MESCICFHFFPLDSIVTVNYIWWFDSVLFHWVFVFFFFFSKSLDFIFQRNFSSVRGEDTSCNKVLYFLPLFCCNENLPTSTLGLRRKQRNLFFASLLCIALAYLQLWEIFKQTQNEFGNKKLVHEVLEADSYLKCSEKAFFFFSFLWVYFHEKCCILLNVFERYFQNGIDDSLFDKRNIAGILTF